MDKDIRFIIEDIKKEMDNLTPVLTGPDLYKYINSITRELMIIGDTDIAKKMEVYKTDQLKVQKDLEAIQKELDTLNKEFYNNIREIMETIRKL